MRIKNSKAYKGKLHTGSVALAHAVNHNNAADKTEKASRLSPFLLKQMTVIPKFRDHKSPNSNTGITFQKVDL